MNNKTMGAQFERDFGELLARHGYWVHMLQTNAAGQPADIIAVKRKKALLIDCKVCSRGRFEFSRIEPNQETSMNLWDLCGNGDAWFALLLDNEVYILSYRLLIAYKNEGNTSLNALEIKTLGKEFSKWIQCV